MHVCSCSSMIVSCAHWALLQFSLYMFSSGTCTWTLWHIALLPFTQYLYQVIFSHCVTDFKFMLKESVVTLKLNIALCSEWSQHTCGESGMEQLSWNPDVVLGQNSPLFYRTWNLKFVACFGMESLNADRQRQRVVTLHCHFEFSTVICDLLDLKLGNVLLCELFHFHWEFFQNREWMLQILYRYI